MERTPAYGHKDVNDPKFMSRRRFLKNMGILTGSAVLLSRNRNTQEISEVTQVPTYNLKANRQQVIIPAVEPLAEQAVEPRAHHELSRNELGFYEMPVYEGHQIAVTSIVLHWTASLYESQDTVGGLLGGLGDNPACGSEGCSIQLFIDKEGIVFQLTPTLDTYAIHARGLNEHSVGIEIEGRGEEDLLSNQLQYGAVLDTVAKVKGLFSVPLAGNVVAKSGLLAHFETDAVYGPGVKSDPGPYFMQQIRHDLAA